jgi:NitT/TauT family transport system substrate-binding protein
MKTKLTPFSKLLIVALVIGGIVAAVNYIPGLKEIFYPTEKTGIVEDTDNDEDTGTANGDVIKIGVVTWGGYAGGQYFNEGFKANTKSRFYKDYGFKVEFKVMDDFNASRSAWKAGEINLLWATIDAFTTEAGGLWDEYEPQAIFQADWSRGGDAVVVRRGINKVSELRGKKVAFAEMTPSHTFLLWLLDAANMKQSDIEAVKVASAIDAADLFKKGQVDAAVVWSPDDAACVSEVKGSKILQNTKQASNIIADVFIVKKDYLEKNRKKLEKLVEGWFKGAAEINNDDNAKQKAAKILEKGLGMPYDFCYDAINNVRLCTYGDNVNFYNLKGNFNGVTGEAIYNKMETKYRKEGYITDKIPSWRLVGNSSLISAINMSGTKQAAEGAATFTKVTEDVKSAEAISTKSVSITFATGASTLDDNMKYIIDNEFLDIAKSFANARIRIQGNTDNTGSAAANRALSKKRAQAVANYLISEHGFDKNRFIIIGNGPDKPIASNNTAAGRAKNRRTDFELVGK